MVVPVIILKEYYEVSQNCCYSSFSFDLSETRSFGFGIRSGIPLDASAGTFSSSLSSSERSKDDPHDEVSEKLSLTRTVVHRAARFSFLRCMQRLTPAQTQSGGQMQQRQAKAIRSEQRANQYKTRRLQAAAKQTNLTTKQMAWYTFMSKYRAHRSTYSEGEEPSKWPLQQFQVQSSMLDLSTFKLTSHKCERVYT